VLPLFFSIGIIFAPIGGVLLWASSRVQEISLDYTNCFQDAPTDDFALMDSDDVFTAFRSSNKSVNAQWLRSTINTTYDNVTVETPLCTLQFDLPEDIGPPVLFYYHLTNFYQNHRQYVNSFYDKQLKGDVVSGSDVNSSNCKPLKHRDGKSIYPCGLIANSLFNDTFTNPVLLNTINSNEAREVYNMTDKGIAWSSDKDLYGNFPSEMSLDSVVPPPNWLVRYPNGYTESNPPPNLKEDEAFIVWMRTAGLPSFSKLYQRNNTAAMRAGTYQLNVTLSKSRLP
jgi:hypothetical protein